MGRPHRWHAMPLVSRPLSGVAVAPWSGMVGCSACRGAVVSRTALLSPCRWAAMRTGPPLLADPTSTCAGAALPSSLHGSAGTVAYKPAVLASVICKLSLL